MDRLIEEMEPQAPKKAPAPVAVSEVFVNHEQFDLRDADSMSNLELDIEPSDSEHSDPEPHNSPAPQQKSPPERESALEQKSPPKR